MLQLRYYQIDLSYKGLDILKQLGIVYLVMSVRTGKTLTSLNIANLYGAKKVLFITKLKAISSIKSDYDALNPNYEIQIINNESLHKITDNDFDLVISDEHHRNSAFPKPCNSAKNIRERFGHLPQIYLSGTPAIESGSQWYHSFWTSKFSPFNVFKNFYDWSRTYTEPFTKHFGALQVKDYSKSKDDEILAIIEPYLVRFTQKDAGFTSDITEEVIYYPIDAKIKQMVKRLMTDLVLEGKEETILGDTAAKLMSKVHQLENGTIIFESGNSMILDTSKAEHIKKYFEGKKIAMFYYFKKEWELLKQVFGDSLTDNLEEFNTTNKHIALQQISGSEGISLKEADVLVYYNSGYSGRQYTQGRDRLTTINRSANHVYFFFDKDGLNAKIYKALKSKKRYNEKLFQKNYKGIINPNCN
jgi:hypothetical protein